MRKVLRLLGLADREQLNEDERADLAAALLNGCRKTPAPLRRFLWSLDAATAGALAAELEPETEAVR